MEKSDKQQQKIVAGFKTLRGEQQVLLQELRVIESQLREWNGVIRAMEKIDPTRLIHRKTGEVMLQSTVADDLIDKRVKFNTLADTFKKLHQKVVEKGDEINEYQKTNGIRILTEQEIQALERGRKLDVTAGGAQA